MTDSTLLDKAVNLYHEEGCDWRTWCLSGYPATGEDVGRHLEAALDLMVRQGWDPRFCGADSGKTLFDALCHVADDGIGDDDTRYAIRHYLALVIEADTGIPCHDYDKWASHPRTSFDRLLAIGRTAADLARAVGTEQEVDA